MCTVNKKLKLIAPLFAFAIASTSIAELSNPHIGADLHFLKMTSGVTSELNKTGFSSDFKVGSFLTSDNWELEGDLGFRYAKLSGTQLNVTKKLSFFSGMLELIPRYRFDEQWSLGVNFTTLFATDLTHDEQVQNSSSLLFLTGLSGRYKFEDSAWSMVMNIRKDINLEDRGLWSAGLGVLYRFGVNSSAPVFEEPRAEVKFDLGTQTLLIRLPEDVLLFGTAKSHLTPSQKSYIRQIGRILMKHNESWEKVSVHGHTDYRGSDESNRKLSVGRALSVWVELRKAGIPAAKISHKGFGETSPLVEGTDDYSLSRNRRVELKVDGAEDNPDLSEELRSVNPASY